MKRMLNRQNFKSFFSSLVVTLPRRKRLTLGCNYGRMLGIILYVADGLVVFSSVQYIISDVNLGWLFRIFHFNGASLFFIFLYLHIFKVSYRLKKVWGTGLLIFLLIMMEAYMGYVLVWAQIRFWAAVVITRSVDCDVNLKRFWGNKVNFKVFFALHFLLP
uniref:Cytochrome b n=1 Tax=Angiostrongylus cantonensis TaxID=6313 RepID=A0A0K0CXU4_ANGCA